MENLHTDYDSADPIFSDGFDYYVDLGSGALESACPTPLRIPTPQPSLPRPIARRTWSHCLSATTPAESTLKELDQHRQSEHSDPQNGLKCGICFEHATLPTRTPCCSQLFCAEHISAWLHSPSSEGLCPVCRSPALSRATEVALRREIPSSQPVEFYAAQPPASSPHKYSFSSACSSSMYSTSHYEYSESGIDVVEPKEDDDQQQTQFERDYSEESSLSRIIPLATWVVLVTAIGVEREVGGLMIGVLAMGSDRLVRIKCTSALSPANHLSF
ncbi:hypothetical protein R3P38DRAFT_3248343 [Favolaschia claudopus]|uniref:RING-type domain-containing protein n=1 Tax=Favolaschia claudopus TaxID=2862362 RepID=A0AAV9YY23_9AGAR